MQVIPFIYDDKDEIVANCYLLIDSKKHCVIIDPSVDYDGVINYIRNNQLKPQGILLTHAHFDHMRGVDRIVNEFHIPLFVHEEDEDSLLKPYENCSDGFNQGFIYVHSKATTIVDMQMLHPLDEEIKVIHTPYHTKGSVCYYLEQSGLLFSGDTLFKMVIGRSDLPTSTPSLRQSTFNKVMSLPKEVKVYPGHGRLTTIGNEQRLNPFVKR